MSKVLRVSPDERNGFAIYFMLPRNERMGLVECVNSYAVKC
jgi:hypothetical protein